MRHTRKQKHAGDNAEPPPPSNDVALLMKMTQRNGKPLPVGSHIERKVYAEIQKLTGANPLGISKLNDQEVLVKFEEKTPIVGVAIHIEKIDHWDEIPVEVGVCNGW